MPSGWADLFCFGLCRRKRRARSSSNSSTASISAPANPAAAAELPSAAFCLPAAEPTSVPAVSGKQLKVFQITSAHMRIAANRPAIYGFFEVIGRDPPLMRKTADIYIDKLVETKRTSERHSHGYLNSASEVQLRGVNPTSIETGPARALANERSRKGKSQPAKPAKGLEKLRPLIRGASDRSRGPVTKFRNSTL